MGLDAAHLYHRLAPRPVQVYSQVDSTQNIAMDWLQAGAPSGAVVIADAQLAGRGRQKRVWSTPPGVGLALSVILRPKAIHLPQIMMLGAVAAVDLLDGLGVPDATIKWPNDLRLKERKVGGVLPEAVWDGDRLRGVVLGIGINVRNDFSGTDLADTAISLEPVLQRHLDRTELIVSLMARIDYWTARLGTLELLQTWQARLETLGRRVVIASTSGTVNGVAEAVDEQGVLLVRDDQGAVHRIFSGDVFHDVSLG